MRPESLTQDTINAADAVINLVHSCGAPEGVTPQQMREMMIATMWLAGRLQDMNCKHELAPPIGTLMSRWGKSGFNPWPLALCLDQLVAREAEGLPRVQRPAHLTTEVLELGKQMDNASRAFAKAICPEAAKSMMKHGELHTWPAPISSCPATAYGIKN